MLHFQVMSAIKLVEKKVLFISGIFFLISAIGFAFAEAYPILILLSILAGMGVGVASNVSPLYISEVASTQKRGRLVTYYQLAVTFGVLAVYISNFFIQRYAVAHIGEDTGLFNWLFANEVWRGMFLVSLLPALAFCLLLMIVPESPCWLVQYARSEDALKILTKINGIEDGLKELTAIEEMANQKKVEFENHCLSPQQS